MRYSIGMDIHRKLTTVAILDPQTGEVQQDSFPSTPEAIKSFARILTPADHIALESSTNTFAFANLLRDQGIPTVISNPLKTKLIAEGKIKTDKIDALTLAQLQASSFLPTVWLPDPHTQTRRYLSSYRSALVSMRTQTKNRLHSILHRNLISSPCSDLFGKKGRAFLEEVSLPEEERWQVDQELALLDFLERQIKAGEKKIAQDAFADPDVRLLMSIPGISEISAIGIKAAIGDIRRFLSPKKLVGYLGLHSAVYQTGKRCYYGGITKQGRSHARWLLIEASQSVVESPGPLRAFFQRLLRKKGRNVAIVAVARKMAVIIWHMLTKGEPYRYALPTLFQEKWDRLRVKATGIRRRGGSPKGAPRSSLYGTGRSGRKEKRAQEKILAQRTEEEYIAFLRSRWGNLFQGG